MQNLPTKMKNLSKKVQIKNKEKKLQKRTFYNKSVKVTKSTFHIKEKN